MVWPPIRILNPQSGPILPFLKNYGYSQKNIDWAKKNHPEIHMLVRKMGIEIINLTIVIL